MAQNFPSPGTSALSAGAAIAFAAVLATAPATAQSPTGDRPLQPAASSSPEVLLDAWRDEHGPSWRMRTNRRTGTLEMLYGGNAAPSFRPDTSEEAQWIELAREWIVRTQDMHGVEPDQLTNPRFRYLPLAQGNTTDKITVRFEQSLDGIPVEDGALNVLFDRAGRLLSIHTTAAPTFEDEGVEPAFGGAFGNMIAAQTFADEYGVAPTFEGGERLVHAWIDDGETRRWELAWECEAMYEVAGAQPIGQLYTIDAETRQVLKSESTVHNFDVFGTISSNATPGLTADRAANPPTPIPMPRVRVTSSAGTVETDRDGNFSIAGVNTPVDLTVTYFGEFTNVNNDQGADYSITFQNVQPNQQNNLLMNPNPSEFLTSQANAQLHINVLRDFIVDRFPNDDTADFRATANVNLNNSCNAFYNGNSVNFYTSGSGCNNTAFSSVVAHEMGHWLNALYGTGNGSDGMGEGNADVFAMYCYDDPIVGRFFSTNGGIVRTGTNTRQYCGDGNGGCYGGVHANGEVWMGAAWKIRTNLNNALGNSQGDLVSDLLFLGWLNSFNQTDIDSLIEIQWLTLDDDDGDINNGTPNYDEIDAGFRQQGFPGFELSFISFPSVTQLADTPDEVGPYSVTATVTPNFSTTITGATLFHQVNGGPVGTLPMVQQPGTDDWTASIPGPAQGAIIRYWVEGMDDAGNTAVTPSEAPANAYEFIVGEQTPIIVSDFESGTGGFTGGVPGDTATTGVWVRGNPIGTEAQPEDDFTVPGVNCWFTGQGSPGGSLGQNDVDDGRTTLISAPFDGEGAEVLLLRYARWYSNDTGNAPNADVFEVEVSNDGGATWQDVETVGPAGEESNGDWYVRSFNLVDTLPATADMQVRFVASDLATGSIVEAAIDDVAIIAIGDVVPAPTNYCSLTLNSGGGAAQIYGTGSQSIAVNTFVVGATGVPAAQFGLFFFGPDQTDVPLVGSEGRLCVGGTLNRLPIVQADPLFGTAVYDLDFTDVTTSAPLITGGSTWNFQFWFRDNVGGMPTSNTTNGLSVVFEN